MEWTRNCVTFHGPLRQVGAHVPAVTVKYVQRADVVSEYHQFGAECNDAMWPTVAKFFREA